MADGPPESLEATRQKWSDARRRTDHWLRGWIESTENLLHVVVLLLVPVLLGFITWLSNVTPFVSFLVYPPLASGTYTLFADPEGEYSTPRRFVGGMTFGALAGWFALEVTARYWYMVPPEQFQVHAGATALAIFLTGLGTWVLHLEEPTAFSAALLALVTGSGELAYVLGITVSSLFVAGAFMVWKERFYEQRAEYLYQTVKSDDRVLVPVREGSDDETALFAAYIAGAHAAGKVVLYRAIDPDTLSEEQLAAIRETPQASDSMLFDTGPEESQVDDTLPEEPIETLREIERYIEETVDIPCELVVTLGDPEDPRAVTDTADAIDCDLIVSQYHVTETDEDADGSREFVDGLFKGDIDVVGFHSTERKTSWSRILVLVKRPGQVAHAMIDFARRLAPSSTNVSICRCIEDTGERSRAESMLRELVSSFQTQFETRVSYGPVTEFMEQNSSQYDLVIIGASSDRSATSRLLTPPTFESIDEIDSDVAIVHKA